MRSVADALRDETRRRAAALTPEARITQALELGEADVAALREARGITEAEARVVFARGRRSGRRPSRAHDD
jgi:hypothetical protein